MDTVGSWLHNANIDRTLERLGAYVDPATRANLFKYLIAQEAEIGDGPHQLNETARRIHEGRARIDRATIIIEGLLDNGLMNVAKFSKAMAVLTTLQDSQVLLEQLHRRMSEVAALETRRLLFLRKFDWNACSNKEFFTPADSPRRPLNKFLVQLTILANYHWWYDW